jgi:hypothetical protein
MASVTENFANLSQVLLADYEAKKSHGRDILVNRLLKPLLPSAFRIGTGQIVDLKDRQLGPFDIVGCWENFPPLGEGIASLFLVDGVAFCLQVRNWKEEDLTQFAATAVKLKALSRKTKSTIICAVAGFEALPADQVSEFMKSSDGQAIDGVLSIGRHLMLRNTQGWYGDPKHIPFVTERGEGESLKSFAFWLVHIMQTFLNEPYQLSDYQHL